MASHLQDQHTIVVLYYALEKKTTAEFGYFWCLQVLFFPKPEVIHMHDDNITKIRSLRSMLEVS